MRWIKLSPVLFALLALGVSACNNEEKAEENAPIVNVEKGVVPPESISDSEDGKPDISKFVIAGQSQMMEERAAAEEAQPQQVEAEKDKEKEAVKQPAEDNGEE